MTRPVALTGLFETHLTVSNLGRSIAYYRDVVGLSLALEVPERGAAFLWIGGPGEAMLGLWTLGSAPMGLSLQSRSEPPSTMSWAPATVYEHMTSRRSRSSPELSTVY